MMVRSSRSFSVEDRPGIEVESQKCDGIVSRTDLKWIARWLTRLAGPGRQKLLTDNH
jgi:hypothetical protein